MEAWTKSFEDVANEHYRRRADALGSSAYACMRAIELNWMTAESASTRRWVRRLIRLDPYSLLLPHVFHLRCLTERDALRLVPHVRIEDNDARHFACGRLLFSTWIPALRKQSRVLPQMIDHLLAISPGRRGADVFRMLVDAYHEIDPPKAVPFYRDMLAAHAPEWQAFPLISILREAVKRGDFATYREFRDLYLGLPPNAHKCECYANHFHTWEGLLALRERRLDDVPESLVRARSVRGCPHLNSGGFDLWLVRKLIRRKLFNMECRDYLGSARNYCVTKELEKLLARIDAA